MISMILVTGTEVYSDLQLLSGILLDPITEADFRKDVFTAYLVSDRTREVVCELPLPSGGMGTTKEGLLLTEVETKLLGLRQHAYARGSNTIESIVLGTIENRIKLVTTGDIGGVVYPALLGPRQTSPPVGTRVVAAIEVERVCDLPEMQAFVVIEPGFADETECRMPIRPGIILPVTCASDCCSLMGAIKLLDRVGDKEFEAVFYHETGKGRPRKGDTLERKVTFRNTGKRQNPACREEILEFNARIGTIARVEC